jgi:hypothetical protein
MGVSSHDLDQRNNRKSDETANRPSKRWKSMGRQRCRSSGPHGRYGYHFKLAASATNSTRSHFGDHFGPHLPAQFVLPRTICTYDQDAIA